MKFEAVLPASSALVEKVLVLLLVGILGYACLVVASPFVVPFIWAVILALSTWPYYLKVAGWLGGRRGPAAVALTLVILLVFVVPVMLAFNAAAERLPSLESLSGRAAELRTSGPPEWVGALPLVGGRLDAEWRAGRLNALLDPQKIRPAIAPVAGWLLQQGANLAMTGLHIILATVMAGLLYAHGEKAATVAERFAQRLGGAETLNALHIAARTVQGVSVGVIGTAIIQAILSGIGFAVAGVPGAPLLGLVSFMTAMMQVGTGLVWIPVALWLHYQGSDGWATFTVAWGIFVNVIDNFIKPYLIGRSGRLPFLLILVGVIGGLLAWGFIGIFLGTTLLAVAYTIFFDWLDNSEPTADKASTAQAVDSQDHDSSRI
ncbi:AI-2E family transporter [Methylomagnum sp.]